MVSGVGHRVSRSAVRRILREHGIGPDQDCKNVAYAIAYGGFEREPGSAGSASGGRDARFTGSPGAAVRRRVPASAPLNPQDQP